MNFRQPFHGEYPITQRFGEVIKGVTFRNLPHTGIDYGCPRGTEILASGDGQVMAAGWDLTGYGFRVILKHTEDRSTLYAHLDDIAVSVGQKVKQGEVIAHSGWTGTVVPKGPGGAHLHFEARKIWNDYNSVIDPMLLPMQSVDDSVVNVQNNAEKTQISAETTQNNAEIKHDLKDADAFKVGDLLEVQNEIGVKAFHDTGFSYGRMTQYPQGSPFYFTGDTAVRKDNGLTYMRVVPATFSVWIAVNDGETQLLDYK